MGPGFESLKVHHVALRRRKNCLAILPHKWVCLTQRVHPFPFRTRKLSSAVATILGGKLPGKIAQREHTVGVFNAEGPPVPIPNTEVKLCSGNNTWREAAREDSTMPTQRSISSSFTRTKYLLKSLFSQDCDSVATCIEFYV